MNDLWVVMFWVYTEYWDYCEKMFIKLKRTVSTIIHYIFGQLIDQ